MLQRDFIMRRVEELSKMIALALKLRVDGHILDGLAVVAQAYKELPDVDQGLVTRMPLEEFEDHFIINNEYAIEYLDILAGLLYEEGEAHRGTGEEDKARSCFSKSLFIYEYVEKETGEFSFERLGKMQRMRAL